jgi:transposase-like protein
MQHYNQVKCIYCSGFNLVKNGHSENGTQRWFCNECGKSFQLDYSYNARKPGVKEQISELTLNSSGVRDIGRILKISKNTVVTELKKNTKNQSLFARHS